MMLNNPREGVEKYWQAGRLTGGAADDQVGDALPEGGLSAGVLLRQPRRHARRWGRHLVRPEPHLRPCHPAHSLSPKIAA